MDSVATKKIYFVRHGQIDANVRKIHSDETFPLTEQGHAQAKFIAQRAAKLPIEAVVSSTMVRSRETAEHIAEALGLVPEYSDLFVESHGIGTFVGRSIDDAEAMHGYAQLHEHYGTPGWRYLDEETFEDHTRRAKRALEYLADMKAEHVLVVTHGLFLSILAAHVLCALEPTPAEIKRITGSMQMENTGISIFRYKNDGSDNPWHIWVWNDHTHLG